MNEWMRKHFRMLLLVLSFHFNLIYSFGIYSIDVIVDKVYGWYLTWRWCPYSVDLVVLSWVGYRDVVNRVAVIQDSSWHRDDGSFAWIACDSNVSAADYNRSQAMAIFPTSKYLREKRERKKRKLNIMFLIENFRLYFSLSIAIHIVLYLLSGIT